jgi:hypothetical protein
MWLTPAVKAVETEAEGELGLGLEPELGAGVEAEVPPGFPDPQPIVKKVNAIMLIKNDFFM